MKQTLPIAVAFFFVGLAVGAVVIWFILPSAIMVPAPAQNPAASSAPTATPRPDVVAAMARCQPMLGDCNAYHDCVRRQAGDEVADGLPDCPATPVAAAKPSPEYIVCFSPPVPADGCDPMTAVIHAIDAAKQRVSLQTYILTSQATVDALVRAAARKIAVTVIVDRQMLREQPELVLNLGQADLAMRVDNTVNGAARDSVLLVDGTIALAGSFDFTGEAERGNADDLLVTNDQMIVERYTANWKFHLAHSDPIELTAVPAPLAASAAHRARKKARHRAPRAGPDGNKPDAREP